MSQNHMPTNKRPMAVQLADTQTLIEELMSRFEHFILAGRTIPVKGVNETRETIFQSGDYRLCQGMAMGMANHCERAIQGAVREHTPIDIDRSAQTWQQLLDKERRESEEEDTQG